MFPKLFRSKESFLLDALLPTRKVMKTFKLGTVNIKLWIGLLKNKINITESLLDIKAD